MVNENQVFLSVPLLYVVCLLKTRVIFHLALLTIESDLKIWFIAQLLEADICLGTYIATQDDVVSPPSSYCATLL